MTNMVTVCLRERGEERVVVVGERSITLMDDRGSKPVVDLAGIPQEVVDRLLTGSGPADWEEIRRLIGI